MRRRRKRVDDVARDTERNQLVQEAGVDLFEHDGLQMG